MNNCSINIGEQAKTRERARGPGPERLEIARREPRSPRETRSGRGTLCPPKERGDSNSTHAWVDE
eukprot:10657915-Lingulodinium_polyedra.AAC.1